MIFCDILHYFNKFIFSIFIGCNGNFWTNAFVPKILKILYNIIILRTVNKIIAT